MNRPFAFQQVFNIGRTVGLIFGSTLLTAGVALANPEINRIENGGATISINGHETNIVQNSAQAILFWKAFNINPNEAVHFLQPAGGITLNRIDPSQGMSQILGQLTATGQIVLVNAAGIYFGPTAHVDVGGLIASTADISNENFLAKKYIFDKPSNLSGTVINDGFIRSASYGLVALLGTNVSNTGTVQANLGSIVLGSGNKFTLDFTGDQLVNFSVDAAAQSVGKDQHGKLLTSGVSNTGSLIANGGKILVSAQVAKNVLDNSINMAGIVEAHSVSQHGGEIILSGGNEGIVQVAGRLDASGENTAGGKIKVLGKNIHLTSHAQLLANGATNGGEILVGGNYQGSGSEYHASNILVEHGALLHANAGTLGNGGKIIVWSNGRTYFHGNAQAMGGSLGGNGGLIETSGHVLSVQGAYISTFAKMGHTGTWLLDPTDITINNSETEGGNFDDSVFTPSDGADTSTINAGQLQNLLSFNDVVINTASTGGGNGDITIDVPIFWESGSLTTLTLNASRNVNINDTIGATNGGLTIHALNTIVAAGADITLTNLIINGSSNINANIITSGNQVYNGAVTLQGNRNFISEAGGINFANGVRGNADLTVNAQSVTFGGTSNLNSLDVLRLANIHGNITTANNQTYHEAVTLTGASRLASTTGSVNMLSTINGGSDLTISANAINLSGAIGDASALRSLTLNGTTNLYSPITTTGSQSFNGVINLHADQQLTTTGSGSININNGINGAGYNLQLTGGGGNLFSLAGNLNINNILINGGTGSNTLQLRTNNATQNFNIASINGGTVTGIGEMTGTFQFSNIQNINGGLNNNNFIFTNAGALNGLINTANSTGTNTLDFSQYTPSIDAVITGNNTGNVDTLAGARLTAFNNIQVINGNGGESRITLANNNKVNNLYVTSATSGYINDPLYYNNFRNFVNASSIAYINFDGVEGVDMGNGIYGVNGKEIYTTNFTIPAIIPTDEISSILAGATSATTPTFTSTLYTSGDNVAVNTNEIIGEQENEDTKIREEQIIDQCL